LYKLPRFCWLRLKLGCALTFVFTETSLGVGSSLASLTFTLICFKLELFTPVFIEAFGAYIMLYGADNFFTCMSSSMLELSPDDSLFGVYI
jgi:hypothetical protein